MIWILIIIIFLVVIGVVGAIVYYKYYKKPEQEPIPEVKQDVSVTNQIVQDAQQQIDIKKSDGIIITDAIESSQNNDVENQTEKVETTEEQTNIEIIEEPEIPTELTGPEEPGELGELEQSESRIQEIDLNEVIEQIFQNSSNYIRTPIKDEKSMNEDYYFDIMSGKAIPEKVYVKIFKLKEFETVDESESEDTENIKKHQRYMIISDDYTKVLTNAGEIVDFNINDLINGLYDIELDFEDVDEIEILCNGLYYDIITGTVLDDSKKYRLSSKNDELKKLPLIELQ